MNITYNRIAGQRMERLAALSDGIFGVAMTLLLLDLHVPEKMQSEAELRHELFKMGLNLLVHLMSFITLSIFWVGQQTQLNHLKPSERRSHLAASGFSICGHAAAIFDPASIRIHHA